MLVGEALLRICTLARFSNCWKIINRSLIVDGKRLYNGGGFGSIRVVGGDLMLLGWLEKSRWLVGLWG